MDRIIAQQPDPCTLGISHENQNLLQPSAAFSFFQGHDP